MPLHILIILVVGGVSLVILLLHGLGKSRKTVLDDQSAQIAWVRHFPESKVISVTTADNGYAALIEASDGPGLLWSFGADTVARYLHDYELHDAPANMKVRFHDFAAPYVTLHLSPSERPIWQKKLAPS